MKPAAASEEKMDNFKDEAKGVVRDIVRWAIFGTILTVGARALRWAIRALGDYIR